jgi:very-short-patch-repair endonuclease
VRGDVEESTMPKETKHHVRQNILHNARELRRSLTLTETKLWQRLRNNSLDGYKFRRQTPMGSYILDFCCFSASLVIEIDGASHDERLEYDEQRTAWLNEQGFKVMRFTNQEILQNLEGILETILMECEKRSNNQD